MVPAQLSVVVGAAAMVAVHWPVTSASSGIVGAIVAVSTIRCGAVTTWPLPSSKVHVTIEIPLIEGVSESLVVPVMVQAQLSVVVGVAVMVAVHWPVTSASSGIVGAIVSVTTIRCGAVTTWPLPSLKVQVTIEIP